MRLDLHVSSTIAAGFYRISSSSVPVQGIASAARPAQGLGNVSKITEASGGLFLCVQAVYQPTTLA
jgi:hypothetical protein